MKAVIKIITINLLLATGMLQLLKAQTKIRGTVLSETGQPLSNVNILLLNYPDSALFKGVVSDSTGSFLVTNIPLGKYMLSFTFTGLRKVCTSPYFIDGSKDDIAVGETRLKKDEAQLDKVTITAKKPLFEQKMDRLVINVQSSVTAAGTTALDVLERSPGVVVDRQNNSLSIGGKDGVAVMINGQENHMPISAIVQMLSGMNAGNIERIELITTPPANFSAEGNAGIINIVLIEHYNEGTNGSFTGTVGGGKNQMVSTALNFNHRKGRINLYGDYSYAINNMYQDFRFYRKIDFGGGIKEDQTAIDRHPVTKIFTGKMGMDIQLSKRTTIGAMVSGYTNDWLMKATSQTLLYASRDPDTIIRTDIHEVNNWKSFVTNLNVYHILGKDESLSGNFDYLYFYDQNPVDYTYHYFTGSNDFLYNTNVRSSKQTPIRFFIGSIDYNRKLAKNTELGIGAKFTFSRFTNDILVTRFLQYTWVRDEDFSASYEMNENIRAGYISVNSDFDRTTKMKIGLRYEYTNSELDTKDRQKLVDRHYGKLFPSLFLSRKLNDHSSLNFSYSRRITRPTFNDLAPFTLFVDPSNFTTGNPGLQPSIADAIGVGYVYNNYIFYVSYTYDNGAIARAQTKINPATNTQVNSSENLANLQTLALTVSIPVNPAAWWSMQYNITGKWQQSNSLYNGTAIIVGQKNFRIAATNRFTLPEHFVFEISGYYQSADLQGRTIREPFGSLDLGLQKKTGKKGKLSLTATDIFNTTIGKGHISIPEQNLVVRRNLQFAQRIFQLTYSRGFGNNNLKGKRNRIDSSEDERKRVE